MSAPRLFLTVLLAILAAVGIIMALSQATGYDLYTGEELGSHAAARGQEQFRRYESCLKDPATTADDCARVFEDGGP